MCLNYAFTLHILKLLYLIKMHITIDKNSYNCFYIILFYDARNKEHYLNVYYFLYKNMHLSAKIRVFRYAIIIITF